MALPLFSELPRAKILGNQFPALGLLGNSRAREHRKKCLSCLAFPESHRRRMRTTNGLERLNQEIKRRTRVVRIFPNRRACLRLVTALAVEQSEEWLTGRRYPDMEELRERRTPNAEREEALMRR
jgi:transposase-like protein